MSEDKEYHVRSNPRQFARHVAKHLQLFCNCAWSKMLEVRLERGDTEADKYEGYIRFLEIIREECKQLAR